MKITGVNSVSITIKTAPRELFSTDYAVPAKGVWEKTNPLSDPVRAVLRKYSLSDKSWNKHTFRRIYGLSYFISKRRLVQSAVQFCGATYQWSCAREKHFTYSTSIWTVQAEFVLTAILHSNSQREVIFVRVASSLQFSLFNLVIEIIMEIAPSSCEHNSTDMCLKGKLLNVLLLIESPCNL